MVQDLRSYLDLVEGKKPDDILTVSSEVDPFHELTATVVKLEREGKRRPVIIFEKVKGSRFSVLTNLHASRSRMAWAMNVAPEEMQRAYLRAMEKPIPPKKVSKAPVKEIVIKGDQINLHDLPQIVHHQDDAGPYITAAISFAKDPASETQNCAYNRLMIQGKDRTSIHLTPGKHLWEFYCNAESRGEPLPVAFAVGVHPAIALGALAIGSIDEDERAIMGALLGEPLELVKCETSDILVPAHAEIIIEGEILARERTPEGPFGEFTGYSLGQRQRQVVKVKAITHRSEPFFQDITVGHLDHLLLSTVPIEANLFRVVRAMVPSVRAVRIPAPFTCYVSIEQRIPGQGKNGVLAVLGSDMYMKRVVIVDQDVDISNDREVTWAIATRCRADRDITVIPRTRGSDLDPSAEGNGYTAKWGVDATAKPSLSAYTPRHRISREVWERINLKDIS
ncbi:MAG: UbiD family decarboxylase [Candidatus Binatia bacterium]|jgi:UbiD family decarboxylase|nr:UbiD family decarboxylase [Candidatus Binatia bacterium]